jgi:hypothetical protein
MVDLSSSFFLHLPGRVTVSSSAAAPNSYPMMEKPVMWLAVRKTHKNHSVADRNYPFFG